jgi:hypothetical protein
MSDTIAKLVVHILQLNLAATFRTKLERLCHRFRTFILFYTVLISPHLMATSDYLFSNHSVVTIIYEKLDYSSYDTQASA